MDGVFPKIIKGICFLKFKKLQNTLLHFKSLVSLIHESPPLQILSKERWETLGYNNRTIFCYQLFPGTTKCEHRGFSYSILQT